MRGKTVSVDVNNVDVRSAQRVTFFENAGAFIDQRVQATVGDFRDGDLTLRNTRFGDPLGNELSHERVRRRAALIVVFVPARAGFLAVPAEFAKVIFRKRLTTTGNFPVSLL